MMRKRVLTLAFLCGAGTASAEEVVFDPAPVIACLDQGAQHVCIGAGLDPCARQHGASTGIIESCLKAEFMYWQTLADRAYAVLEEWDGGIDADTEYRDPQPPSRIAALERTHAAWTTYRDAHCEYVTARWHGGTGAGGAYFRCMMELTGAFALQLQPYIWRE